MQINQTVVQLAGVLTQLLLQLTVAIVDLWELLDMPGPLCRFELPVPQTLPHLNSTLQHKPTPLSAVGDSSTALVVLQFGFCLDQGDLHW